MSVYDKLDYKTLEEKISKKLLNTSFFNNKKQNNINYKKEILRILNDKSAEDVKELLNLNSKEQEMFDYYYKDDYITEDFFNNINEFDKNMSEENKADYMINYMKEKYLLITPKIMINVFNEFGINFELETNLNEEMKNFFYILFNKEALNLSNNKDISLLKSFILGNNSMLLDNNVDNLPKLNNIKKDFNEISNNTNNNKYNDYSSNNNNNKNKLLIPN